MDYEIGTIGSRARGLGLWMVFTVLSVLFVAIVATMLEAIAQDEKPPVKEAPVLGPIERPLKDWKPLTSPEEIDQYLRAQHVFDALRQKSVLQSVNQVLRRIEELEARVKALEQ